MLSFAFGTAYTGLFCVFGVMVAALSMCGDSPRDARHGESPAILMDRPHSLSSHEGLCQAQAIYVHDTLAFKLVVYFFYRHFALAEFYAF